MCVLIVALLPVSCRTGINYAGAHPPRYASLPVPEPHSADRDDDVLKVVSFNIAFAKEVERAIDLLRSEPSLRGADVLLLQEMDAAGTERIAEALDMDWVYYPAVRSLRSGRDFGNAVLSTWPIVADSRLVLPHEAFLRGTQRTATAATIVYRETEIRVYSAHLGTPLEISGASRAEQLRAILEDASRYPHAIVGGDMNSHGVGDIAVEHGFAWPTRDGPRTTTFGRWDHIFLRGSALVDGGLDSGTVRDDMDASDHHPVWVGAVVR